MKEEIYHAMAEVERTHWWFVGRRRIVDHLLSRAALPSEARILEIGCGTGGNLEMLTRHGRVDAVELDETARGYARQRGSVEVREGRLPDDIPFETASFDLVVLTDVLEHVEREAESLAAIRELLVPGGTLLLTVPAMQSLWSEHDESHHHLRRYGRSELQKLVVSGRLRTDLLSYYNFWLFPAVVLGRFLSRWRLHRADQDLEVPAAAVNRLLAGIFGSERHLLVRTKFPFGVSLILMARRDA